MVTKLTAPCKNNKHANLFSVLIKYCPVNMLAVEKEPNRKKRSKDHLSRMLLGKRTRDLNRGTCQVMSGNTTASLSIRSA